MKIALSLCPGWGRDVPPYTLALLSACLRRDKNKVFVFDINNLLYHSCKDRIQWNWEESAFWQNSKYVNRFLVDNERIVENLVARLMATEARVFGFSSYLSNKLMSLKIAELIKKKNPEKIIIFGGAECDRRNTPYELIREHCVDIVVMGEAEETFPEIIKMIESNGQVNNSPGMMYKKNGKIIDCGDRHLLKNLDSLPFADFTDFDFSLYRDIGDCYLMCSRGCTEKCVFCSARNVYKGYRNMSGERIYKEIEYQLQSEKRPGITRHFIFTDSLFNSNMKNLIKFCDLMIENRQKLEQNLHPLPQTPGIKGRVYWACQAIIKPELTLEVLEKMKKAGCIDITYGVESGSPRVYKLMRKRFSPELAEKILRDTYKVGIKVSANFMFGFPGETEEDLDATLKFIERNAQYIDRIYPSRTLCALERFSYLESHRKEFGILPQEKDHHLYWKYADGKNNYLERLRRYKKFCEVVESKNPVALDTGVSDSVREEFLSLARYYQIEEDYAQALNYYQKYLESTGSLSSVEEEIKFCKREINERARD